MSFEINVNADQSINYVSRFKKGRDSLSAMGARWLVESLNKLDQVELIAVLMAIKAAPFPLGGGVKVYEACLQAAHEIVKAGTDPFCLEPLGQVRKAMCIRYCGGMNAPGDSYIKIAVKVKEGTAIGDEY